jgi:GT2 family glycosyltransferase
MVSHLDVQVRKLVSTLRKNTPEWLKEPYRQFRAGLLSIDLSRTGTFDQPQDEIQASQDISVVIAIHDSFEPTCRCLKSIERYGAKSEIVLVDDASELKETVNMIREYQERNSWKVIRHDKTMGHSQSCADGARVSTRPYLCFLNSDTFITPWSWAGAKQAFELDPRIAVTGPSTSWAGTKQKVRRAEYCRNYWTDNQSLAFAEKYVSSHRNAIPVDLYEVSGFAFFIRRIIWNDLGGFDLHLPDYGNESELCVRLSKRGFRIVWTQNSYIHHFGQKTFLATMGREQIVNRRLAAKAYIDRLHKRL